MEKNGHQNGDSYLSIRGEDKIGTYHRFALFDQFHRKCKNHFVSKDRKEIVKGVKGILYIGSIIDKIRMIKHPTTIIIGENDQLTDLSEAQILNSNIKNSNLKIIPKAGHMSPAEEPRVANNIIIKHINKILS